MARNSKQNVKFVNLDIFARMEHFQMFATWDIIITHHLKNVSVVKKGRNAALLLAKKQFANSIHTIRLKDRPFVLNVNMERPKAVLMELLPFSVKKLVLIMANYLLILKHMI